MATPSATQPSHASHASAVSADRPRVGLVVGSGGIKCAAAVGLWKVLAREGIEVDVAIGCSGGSIYTAALALGEDVGSAEERTFHMWQDLFSRFHLRSLLRVALPRLFGFSERVGLLDDRRIWEVMQSLYGDRTFADTRIPLFISATDLRSTEKVVLTEGRIADAVRASIAMPLLLRPWPVGDRLLIDGGASNPLPVDIAILEGCEIIIAMGFEGTPHDEFGSMMNVIAQTTTITINHLLRATYAFYSVVHHAEIVPIIPSFEHRVRLGDAHLIPYIIEQGERAAEAEMPYLRRLLASRAHARPPR